MNYREYTLRDMGIQRMLKDIYELQLHGLPKGTLYFIPSKNLPYYYQKSDKMAKPRILKKSDSDTPGIISGLKLRKWLETGIGIIERNLIWQEKMLKHYRPYDISSIQHHLSDSYRDLPEDYIERLTLKRSHDWAMAKFEGNPYYYRNLKYKTSFGLMVRSKSEIIIAEMLHAAGILFRYEPKIKLTDQNGNTKSYYPDFVIMLASGELLYWEHCGRLDLDEYRKRLFDKITIYHNNGISIGNNLIITTDTIDQTLDVEMIQRIIDNIRQFA